MCSSLWVIDGPLDPSLRAIDVFDRKWGPPLIQGALEEPMGIKSLNCYDKRSMWQSGGQGRQIDLPKCCRHGLIQREPSEFVVAAPRYQPCQCGSGSQPFFPGGVPHFGQIFDAGHDRIPENERVDLCAHPRPRFGRERWAAS